MVRNARPLSSLRTAAIRLLTTHALAAHQSREPAASRPRMAGRSRALVLEARDRRPVEQDRAADVRTTEAPRDDGGKPNHRIADGNVFGGRRDTERLPFRALRRARDR